MGEMGYSHPVEGSTEGGTRENTEIKRTSEGGLQTGGQRETSEDM